MALVLPFSWVWGIENMGVRALRVPLFASFPDGWLLAKVRP